MTMTSLERHVVSNHRSLDCLFNRLCGPTSKKHQNPRYWPVARGIHRSPMNIRNHDDVIKWKHFPCYWPFVRGIHRSLVNSPHKGQWRGALTFSLICTRTNGWANNWNAGDLRRHRAHYDVTVMLASVGWEKYSDIKFDRNNEWNDFPKSIIGILPRGFTHCLHTGWVEEA